MSDELNMLAGAYALDALDPAERAEFEEHLKTCTRCAEEVAGLRAAAAEMTHLVATPAPPAMRANVLGEISRVRPMPPVTGKVAEFRRRGGASRWWPALAAACLVLALAATVWGIQQRPDGTSVAADLHTVLTAPDARVVVGEMSTGGRASVVVSEQLNRVVFVGNGVSDPGPGKTYELWRIRAGGAPVPAGTFDPDNGTVITELTADGAGTTAIAVTVERDGGVPAPTTQAVLSLRL